MRKFTLMVLLGISAAAMVFAGPGSDNSANTIPIGLIAPLSGPNALYGQGNRKGVELAIAEINAAGGLSGKQLKLIAEDDESDPAKSLAAFQKLTTRDHVKFIIGSATSGATMGFTATAQAQKVLVISPSATNVNVTLAGDYIFRACFLDPFQGVVQAKFAYSELGSRRAALLFDNGNDYCVGLTDTFRQAFKDVGGTVVADEKYQTGEVDFNAQITTIKAANPDVIFVPDYYSTASLLAKQLRAQGITAPVLGADGWDGITANAGEELLPAYYTAHYAADSTDPDVLAFIKNFGARFNGEIPLSFSSLAYDCLKLIADAITRAGTDEVSAVRTALSAANIKLVTGNFRFDRNGDPIKSAQILEVVKGPDGKLIERYRSTVNP
jgi:branched-chain amino acid transport system substrate-binding protein